MMLLTLAGRELRSLFLSPLAWTILAVVQLLLGYLFLGQVDFYLQLLPRLASLEGAPGLTQLVVAPLFGNAAIVLLLVIPLLTMRLVADERRNRTLSLLFSAPLSMTEIVLGKFLGVMGFLAVMLGLICLMPLSLLLGGSLDWGVLFSGLLGLSLLLGAFAAAGLFFSTLTSQPAAAAVASFGLLLLLWVLDWAGNSLEGAGRSVLSYLSLLRHYEALLEGVFKTSDVVYYLLFIIAFLVLGIRRLDNDRLQH